MHVPVSEAAPATRDGGQQDSQATAFMVLDMIDLGEWMCYLGCLRSFRGEASWDLEPLVHYWQISGRRISRARIRRRSVPGSQGRADFESVSTFEHKESRVFFEHAQNIRSEVAKDGSYT